MKRALFAAVLLSLALVVPALALESGPPTGPAPSFDEKKTLILKHLDERITKLQQEKDCVKATKSDEDLNGCMAKFGPPRGPGGPSGMGRPGGMGGMGRPGSPGGTTIPGGQTPPVGQTP
jgi:hypothetical protein